MRWAARILGLVALGLFVLFLAGTGTSTITALSFSDPQGLPLLLALVVALAGVLIAWRWELVGGAMAVGGAALITALVCAGSGFDMLYCGLLFTAPLMLAGLLYLGCCWRTRTVAPVEQL
jgi:hypothetical protein